MNEQFLLKYILQHQYIKSMMILRMPYVENRNFGHHDRSSDRSSKKRGWSRNQPNIEYNKREVLLFTSISSFYKVYLIFSLDKLY